MALTEGPEVEATIYLQMASKMYAKKGILMITHISRSLVLTFSEQCGQLIALGDWVPKYNAQDCKWFLRGDESIAQ